MSSDLALGGGAGGDPFWAAETASTTTAALTRTGPTYAYRCRACNGVGRAGGGWLSASTSCRACEGKGHVFQRQRTCRRCNGSGMAPPHLLDVPARLGLASSSACPNCRGVRFVCGAQYACRACGATGREKSGGISYSLWRIATLGMGRERTCRACQGLAYVNGRQRLCRPCQGRGLMRPGALGLFTSNSCRACNGRRLVTSKQYDCRVCNGAGAETCIACEGRQVLPFPHAKCSTCEGRGQTTSWLRSDTCNACAGRGMLISPVIRSKRAQQRRTHGDAEHIESSSDSFVGGAGGGNGTALNGAKEVDGVGGATSDFDSYTTGSDDGGGKFEENNSYEGDIAGTVDVDLPAVIMINPERKTALPSSGSARSVPHRCGCNRRALVALFLLLLAATALFTAARIFLEQPLSEAEVDGLMG